ncbi:MAG: TonB-dependent receptor plug domain-containing protein [Luteitalea sp.]|nr:TonB-dependent receptor plug domain-containing protein [Luteitalea sp.]
MSIYIRRLAVLALLLCPSVLTVSRAAAQNVTTGAVSGIVVDEQQAVLPGATVVAVHEPTGTTYETVTLEDGQFQLLNVRAGGPYQVTVALPGFRDEQRTGLNVPLGSALAVNVTLQLATVAETVEVTAQASETFSSATQGTASNVPQAAIETLPTIARRIDDFARTNPFIVQTPAGQDGSALSVAGRNNRYNSIQVDGAVNNDLFGLAASGVPGGQADAQPVSLDAIQELQLVVAPYDVRQGGFAGGGINAITKSGANNFFGTGYYYGRTQALVGDGIDEEPVSDFEDQQFGASVGGPLVRNQAFFFGLGELNRRSTPTGFSADDWAAVSDRAEGRRQDVTRFVDILQNQYGYDPGPVSEFSRQRDNNMIFARGDLNLSPNHRLTVRHNYIDPISDIGSISNSTFLFPDSFYQFNSAVNSTVGQLNSQFGGFVNELRVTYQRIRDRRGGSDDFPGLFPHLFVNIPDGTLEAGREEFSTANELDQDVVEVTNDLTFVRGRHTFTLGTHNEFFSFRNLFIRDNFGTYRFDSLDFFEQGLAQQFDYSFSATSDPEQAAEFAVRQFGFYAGDQWRLAPQFTLTYGLRVDLPRFPDDPARNPVSEELFGFRSDVTPNDVLWSPRVGFNYDLGTDTRQQLRGGLGLFAGRTPYVWLSNQYSNTGLEFTRLNVPRDADNRIPFVPDPSAQPTTVGDAATNEIDLIDPDYRFPQVIRGNLGYDREVGGGLIATAELLFSNSLKDIAYQNLNLEQIGTQPDGRPLFQRANPELSDVILLTNTDEGENYNLAFKLERPLRDGWFASGSYAYGYARSLNDGTSSQAASNWGNLYVPGDPNNAPVARSNFEVHHRINLSGSYRFDLRQLGVTASAFYNGQSGRPYSSSFSFTDVNGDGRNANDQLYIPASADEVVFSNGTYDDLLDYVALAELEDYIGQIVPRNASFTAWTHIVDFRVAVDVPLAGRRGLELAFDVFNLGNVFGNETGLIRNAGSFQQLLPVRFGGIDDETGKMIFDLSPLSVSPFTIDDLRSRWQGQFSIRFRF